MLKKIIAWPTSWALWILGDLFSRLQNFSLIGDHEKRAEFFYVIYNGLMVASSDVQDWAELKSGPWDQITFDLDD